MSRWTTLPRPTRPTRPLEMRARTGPSPARSKASRSRARGTSLLLSRSLALQLQRPPARTRPMPRCFVVIGTSLMTAPSSLRPTPPRRTLASRSAQTAAASTTSRRCASWCASSARRARCCGERGGAAASDRTRRRRERYLAATAAEGPATPNFNHAPAASLSRRRPRRGGSQRRAASRLGSSRRVHVRAELRSRRGGRARRGIRLVPAAALDVTKSFNLFYFVRSRVDLARAPPLRLRGCWCRRHRRVRKGREPRAAETRRGRARAIRGNAGEH